MRFDKTSIGREELRKSNRPVLPIQFAAEGLRSSFEFMRLWLLGSDRCQWIDNQDNQDSLVFILSMTLHFRFGAKMF